ncbi:MAG: DUF480 domain-containing protein, partial [Solirubrobacterales bacterium]
PVVDYDEELIHETLQRMHRRELTRVASGHGSRSSKYRHLVPETLGIGDPEQALLCVLLLRGDQTPGELKSRADRLYGFADLEAVDETLDGMIADGLVRRLDRRPGEKQVRYRQLLGDEDAVEGATTDRVESAMETVDQLDVPASIGSAASGGTTENEEIAALRADVASLRAEVDDLRARLDG